MTTLASPFSKIARTGFFLACAAVLGLPVLPAVHAAPTPAATASPAAATAPLDARDVASLHPHINEKVEVRGTATTTGQNKPGTIAYLNFGPAHQAVALVFFLKPGQTGRAGTVDDLKPFVGKSITVSGTLTEFKGDLQIVVETLDQIKVAP